MGVDRETENQRQPCQNLYQPEMPVDKRKATPTLSNIRGLTLCGREINFTKIIQSVAKQIAMKTSREGGTELLQYII